ncbi:MAG: ribosome biogenesis GTPase Der, partial [Bacteroidota bacterium]
LNRLKNAIEVAIEVFERRQAKIKTSDLNEVMLAAIDRYPPPSHKGRFAKIKYITQLPTYYPAFAFFCNNPKYIKDSYKQYLENQLRKSFNFEGVPISIFLRKK